MPRYLHSLIGLAFVGVCTYPFTVQAKPPFGLGRAASSEEIALRDMAIGPLGLELPAGTGTARTGQSIYETHCLHCHGDKGEGGLDPRLAGGLGTLTTAEPIKTIGSYWPYATTIFDYVRRAMPLYTPGSLTNDQTYALTAYLLYINGIIEIDRTMDAVELPSVQMPNKAGFQWPMELIDSGE
jgi:mono/diheme cytochrome c family protein